MAALLLAEMKRLYDPAFMITTDLKQTRPSVVTPSGVSAPVALGSRNQDLPHPFPH